jgi:hypothetical protein
MGAQGLVPQVPNGAPELAMDHDYRGLGWLSAGVDRRGGGVEGGDRRNHYHSVFLPSPLSISITTDREH